MLAYDFNVFEKYPDGLIPKAIYEARLVKPCDEIREKWEAAVARQARIDELGLPPRFSWRNFLEELRNVIP